MATSRIACETAPTDAPDTPATTSEKSLLRLQLLAARKVMTPAAKMATETAICARLLAWLRQHPVASLGVYYPIRQEPELYPVYSALNTQGVHLSLPIIRGNDLPLEFVRWTPGEMLVKDAMGTSAPPHGETVQPHALLIPCLGFNAARVRLGYGGGFYDRTLAPSPRPLAIGVAYANARVDFAAHMHDIALDLIITETISVS